MVVDYIKPFDKVLDRNCRKLYIDEDIIHNQEFCQIMQMYISDK